MQPILSLCIPTFERSNLLRKQLDSIKTALSEIPPGICEIIISDNASTDDTQKVIDEYKDKINIVSKCNDTNIGAMRNILGLPSFATGKYIWLLGDDDLIFSNSIKDIVDKIHELQNITGFVISHAIEFDICRDDIETRLKNSESVDFKTCLIKQTEKAKIIGRFEEVFGMTAISAPLNFISNVIFLREEWVEKSKTYIIHCENIDTQKDAQSWFGHLCLWAEIYSTKPVYVFVKPLLVGFVGAQPFLSKWEALSFTSCLDVSKIFLQNKADKFQVLKFQRSIYSNSGAILNLIESEDEFTRQCFSIQKLLQDYGGDKLLWEKVFLAVTNAKSIRIKLKIIYALISNLNKNPSQISNVLRASFEILVLIIKKILTKIKFINSKKYEAEQQNQNVKATIFFKKTVAGSLGSNVEHPLYLKNQKYLKVGDKFYSKPGLRIEAWDEYKGKNYQPEITIGDRAILNFNCHIGAINLIKIGDDALIGSNVLITDHQHGDLQNLIQGKSHCEQPLFSKGPVIIGNNVWIGENVCIMPNVSIGDNCIIGCNAVVTKSFANNSVIAGNPAKLISTIVSDSHEKSHRV